MWNISRLYCMHHLISREIISVVHMHNYFSYFYLKLFFKCIVIYNLLKYIF